MFLNFNYCRTSLLSKQNSPVFQKFVFHITHKNYAGKSKAKLPSSTLVNFKSATNGAGATTANNSYDKFSVKVLKTKSIFICHKSSYSFLSLLQTSKNTFAFQNKSLLNPTDTFLHNLSQIKAQTSFPIKTQDCQDATGSNISSSKLLSVNQSSDLRNLNLNEWKKTCSRQCIIRIISVFFKLIYMVIHGLLRILCLLGKVLFLSKLTTTIIEAAKGKTANKVKEIGKKTASNAMKGAKKSGVIMAREMPKAMEALQKNIPIWLENLQEFSKRIDHELRQAKTQEEKIARFSKIVSTAVRKSTMYRNLKLVLFGYGIFLAVRFSISMRS